MNHLTTVKRAASLLALTAAGLPSLAGPASAASTPSATYSCSLAAYAQGMAPLTIPAALTAQGTGDAVTVTLVTQPVTLPSAAVAVLPQFSYLSLAGAAPSNGMSAAAVKLSGRSGYLGGAGPGNLAQLPAMTATGSTAAGGGLTSVAVPPTLTLTPEGAGSATPLTCTTATAVTVQVAAAGTAPVTRRPGVHVHGDGGRVRRDGQQRPDAADGGAGHRRHAGHAYAVRAGQRARPGLPGQRHADVRVGAGQRGRERPAAR